MWIDPLAEDILTGENIGFFLGVPREKETAVGQVNGSNKDFLVPNPPIYPRSGDDLVVKNDDVDVVISTTGGESPATVSSIIFDDDEDYAKGFTLSEAPSSGTVKVTYVEELEPFIAQDVTPDVKQDTKEVSVLNRSSKITSYSGLTISLKSEQILSKNGLRQLQALMYEPAEAGSNNVEAYKLRDKPLNLYGYMLYHVGDEILGRIYLENVRIQPDLPGGKAGDNLSFTLEMSVASTPVLIMPKT